ncbi:MAG TPA: MFS transporter [Ktedonobacteraceae bacterium]|nr:MFS transporter [Ktedonobacteraceae bacterium]
MALPQIYAKRKFLTLPTSLHPLAERDFGIFWLGAFLSSIGFWVQTVGQGWQVLQLTNSALLLGFVGFAATLPNIILSLFGGVIADRFNRRLLLLLTQTVYMCTATLLGILTTLHIIAVWQIILMALINGTFSTIGWPAWQAFIGELIEPGELKQGIALNSTQFNLSRVIGPAIGGFAIAMVGIAGNYYLNALSYLAVIIPLLFLRPKHLHALSAKRQSMWRDLSVGVNYARKRPLLQVVLLLQFLIAFLVFPYTTLLPIFARDIFHIGATGLGILNAAAGLGALLGAVFIVLFTQRMEHSLRVLIMLCVAGGVTALAFALSHGQQTAIPLLILLGSCTVASTTVTNTTVQTMTPEDMRGRVLSIWVMVNFGLGPFGTLVAGWVAQTIGAPLTLATGGLLCASGTVLVALLQRRHRFIERIADLSACIPGR